METLIRDLFAAHGWALDDIWRVVGHRTEVWRRGRKDDPDGARGVMLSVSMIREKIAV